MLLFSDLDQHKRLFLLALPMILSNITVPLLGLVDTAVIGHLSHAYYLGGSTIGAMVITSVVWLCGFLRMSTTGLSAQAFGRSSKSENLMVLYRGLAVALAIGTVLLLLQTPFIRIALTIAGGSEQVQFYANQYAQIRIWGVPAALANLVIFGWLLGNHQSKAVMWLLILTNLVNVILDIVFVFAFQWQVAGVALASVIAEYSAFICGLIIIFNQHKTDIFNLITDGRTFMTKLFERHIISAYFKLNRDILIRTICLQSCFMFITFQGARMGDDVVAANAILMNFLLLISFGLDGIANAAEALVGKAHGKRDKAELTSTINIALFWTAIFALLYTLLFAVAGKQLLSLISSIESVIDYAQNYLIWMIFLPIISCWCFLYDGVYVGLMQAKAMRNSMIISTFLCFFPLWYLLQPFENHGLWAAFSLFMLARGVTLAWHFHRQLKPEYTTY